MRKAKISAFLLVLILSLALLIMPFGAFSVSAAEGAGTQVTATTTTSVNQGNIGYCYVYIDSLESLSSLSVTVHYDSEKIKVESGNVYNTVSSLLNDKSVNESSVQFSYIFDGNGENTKTQLFYFSYTVLSDAEVGDTYFDIIVNEAYDSSLQPLTVRGSRCAFSISETVTTKSCSISSSYSISTSVGEEFELSYRLSTYQIASGSFVISYDPELLEVVDVTDGDFCDNKIVDVNAGLAGSVYVSFVGTEYNTNRNLITVKFKTLKNVTEASDIKFTVTDLYDLELNPISCSGYTTTANITFDEAYTEDAPSMTLQAAYNEATDKVALTIKLDKDSKLGAGDFVLRFNANYLTYSSAEKGFAPTFFNINDKDAVDGELKFSIISLADITDAQTVLTVVFDVKRACEDKLVELDISGSGLSDSMTNPILLNFVDATVTVPLEHVDGTDNNHLCDKGCGRVADEGCYDNNTDHVCDECYAEGLGEHTDGSDNDHLCEYGCGQIADGGCHDVNTDTDHKCDECGEDNVTEHIDGNDNNHLCDNGCGAIADEGCYDNDRNHACDECGKTNMGTHSDSATDNDHVCDYGCNEILEKCSGGTATCQTLASCAICGQAYGELGGHDYDMTRWVSVDEGKHAHKCKLCAAYADEAAHFSLDEATCTENKLCDVCEYEISAALGHIDDDTDHECDRECGKTNMGTHSDSATDNDHVCDYGCNEILENCSGGTETCAEKAICGVCNQPYGEMEEHDYAPATCVTPSTCRNCPATTGTALGHVDADTDHKCDRECGKTDIGTHADSDDNNHLCDYGCGEVADEGCYDTDPVDARCDECGIEVSHEHTGGAATCQAKARCEVCNTEYGELAQHKAENEWQKNKTHHWHDCAGCDEQELEKAAHADGNSDGKCDTCNYQMSTVNPGTDPVVPGTDTEPQPPSDPDDEGGDGLGAGAISAIVISSVAVLGGGGFALFWFVIRKKRVF